MTGRAVLFAAGSLLLLWGRGSLGHAGAEGQLPSAADDACGDDQACAAAFVQLNGRKLDAGAAADDAGQQLAQGQASGDGRLLLRLLRAPPPLGIIGWAGLWGMGLLLLWANPHWTTEFKAEANDRLLGLAHAFVATGFGLATELTTSPACEVGESWISGAVQMTMGFFIVDAVSMLVIDVWKRMRPVDSLMFVHHFFILFCFGCGVFCDLAVWFTATLLINEASTPFLHMFWYLTYTGRKDSKLFLVNGFVLVLSFFFARMVFIPFNYYQFASIGYCSGREGLRGVLFWLINPFYGAIWLLNLVWFYKLVRGAVKKLVATLAKAPNPSEAEALSQDSSSAD